MADSSNIHTFTDVFEELDTQPSQPMSLSEYSDSSHDRTRVPPDVLESTALAKPAKYTGQYGQFRSIQEIDPKYRDVFSYPYFNVTQSRIIDDALYSDRSVVVCAPTGSGKTVVFEMAIVRLLMELETHPTAADAANFKIVYMAPVKALCAERLSEWYPKFTRLGLLCVELTGDTDVDFTLLAPYRIIITTPEKWDMLTRRWREFRDLVEQVRLFLIDEVHVLHDDTRGPVLEAVVSRMKTIEESIQAGHRVERARRLAAGEAGEEAAAVPRIRLVAVSATIGNPEDVAAWLSTPHEPAVYYKLGEECRPVPLRRVVEGYPCPAGTPMFKFDMQLSYRLWPLIEKYYDGKPTLIFCSTRKSVTMTAEVLARRLSVRLSDEQRARLQALGAQLGGAGRLRALAAAGVGCHHAGLLYAERVAVESAFRQRDLPVLVTTTTLAMGVNLPAHLVIIKSTQQYVNGQYQEYPASTVLQMVGRAGRPQHDTDAVAVIMTRAQDKARYVSLADGGTPLESALHLRLAEHLNSEVALRSVTQLEHAVQWARSTFLHVRAARDPRRYLGLQPGAPYHLVRQKLQDMCMKAMNGLAKAQLVTLDEACCVEPTPAGRLMSLYCLDFETMKLIMQISGRETMCQLLAGVVCESHELAGLQLRADERRTLNSLNRSRAAAAGATVRFPLRGRITTKQMKFNILIQAVLGCLYIPDPSLHQEALKLVRTAERICKCMVAYVTRPGGGDSAAGRAAAAALSAATLAKCCSARLWEQSPHVSRQLRGVGPALGAALVAAGKTTFALLAESHPRDLERIMNKSAPAGNALRQQASLVPQYRLTAQPAAGRADGAVVTLELLNAAHMAAHAAQLPAGDEHRGHLLVGDSDNRLLLCAAFKDKELMRSASGTLTYSVRRLTPTQHTMNVHCISSNFVGVDVQTSLVLPGLQLVCQEHGLNAEVEAVHSWPSASPAPAANAFADTAKSFHQTSITDTFQMRKRIFNDSESNKYVTQSTVNRATINNFISKADHFGKDTHDTNECKIKLAHNYVGANGLDNDKLHENKGFNSELNIESSLEKNSREMEIDSQQIQFANVELHENELFNRELNIKSCLEKVEKEMESEPQPIKFSNVKLHENEGFNSELNIELVLEKIEREMESYEKLIKFAKVSPKKDERNLIFRGNLSQQAITENANCIQYLKTDLIKNMATRQSLKKNQIVNEEKYVQEEKCSSGEIYNKYFDRMHKFDHSSEEEQKSPHQDTFTDSIQENLHRFLKEASNNSSRETDVDVPSDLLDNFHPKIHNNRRAKDGKDFIDSGEKKPNPEDASFASTNCNNHLSKAACLKGKCGQESTISDNGQCYELDNDLNSATNKKTYEIVKVDKYSELGQDDYAPNPMYHYETGHDSITENVYENNCINDSYASYLLESGFSARKITTKVDNIQCTFKEKLSTNSRLTLTKSPFSVHQVDTGKGNIEALQHQLNGIPTTVAREKSPATVDKSSEMTIKSCRQMLKPVDGLKFCISRSSNISGHFKHKIPLNKKLEITEILNVTKLQIKTKPKGNYIELIKTGERQIKTNNDTYPRGPKSLRSLTLIYLKELFNDCNHTLMRPSNHSQPCIPISMAFSSCAILAPDESQSSRAVKIDYNKKTENHTTYTPTRELENIAENMCIDLKKRKTSPVIQEPIKKKYDKYSETQKEELNQTAEDKFAMCLETKKSGKITEYYQNETQDISLLQKERHVPICVSSILKKYSSSLRNIGKINKSSNLNKSNVFFKKEFKPKTSANRKLFNIEDINNIDVGISVKERDCEKKVITRLPNIMGSVSNKLNNEDLELTSDHRNAVVEVSSEQYYVNGAKRREINNRSFSPQYLEHDRYPEPNNVLFNPKCLLASCKNDLEDLVLPPPLEFSDAVHNRAGIVSVGDESSVSIYASLNGDRINDYIESDISPDPTEIPTTFETWTLQTDCNDAFEHYSHLVPTTFQPLSIGSNPQYYKRKTADKLKKFKFLNKDKIIKKQRHS